MIVDLVLDKPHWKANLAVPAANPEMLRLLNVALTRARKRLLVVGNVQWLRAKTGSAFLGRHLLPFLQQRYSQFPAADILRNACETGAASTLVAAKAASAQLLADIVQAERRIVLFSPLLSPVRDVLEALGAAIRRGLSVLVVALPLAEYAPVVRPAAAAAEQALRNLGARLIPKTKMLEKLAIFDERVVWCSSRGLLGGAIATSALPVFRAVDPSLARELLDIYSADSLAQRVVAGPFLCPTCGSEVLLADAGKWSKSSFYWRCSHLGCPFKCEVG